LVIKKEIRYDARYLPTSSKLGQFYGNSNIMSAHRGRSSWWRVWSNGAAYGAAGHSVGPDPWHHQRPPGTVRCDVP